LFTQHRGLMSQPVRAESLQGTTHQIAWFYTCSYKHQELNFLFPNWQGQFFPCLISVYQIVKYN
jgi:hypothetical protein